MDLHLSDFNDYLYIDLINEMRKIRSIQKSQNHHYKYVLY